MEPTVSDIQKIRRHTEGMTNERPYWHPVFLLAFAVTLLFARTAFPKEIGQTWQDKAGPIPITNQFPIQLLFLQPTPDRADILPKGKGLVRLNTTLTNSLVSRQSAHYDVTVDMEALRTCLDVGYGISSWLELGYSVPVSYYWAGILDGFIYDVEKFLGSVRGIREVEERYKFTYHVKKDGKTVISGTENTTGIGDIPIRLKAKVFDQGDIWPAVSARASVKLPTGKKSKAFGSGEFDWGLGLLFEKDIKNVSMYLNGDVTFPGDAYEDDGISLQEFYTLLIGLEYRFSSRFSLLAQTYHITRPFSQTGVAPLDRRIHELLVGVSYRTKGNLTVQGGFMEDIIDSLDAGADVTFFLNIGMEL
jgi:hypothetical protein